MPHGRPLHSFNTPKAFVCCCLAGWKKHSNRRSTWGAPSPLLFILFLCRPAGRATTQFENRGKKTVGITPLADQHGSPTLFFIELFVLFCCPAGSAATQNKLRNTNGDHSNRRSAWAALPFVRLFVYLFLLAGRPGSKITKTKMEKQMGSLHPPTINMGAPLLTKWDHSTRRSAWEPLFLLVSFVFVARPAGQQTNKTNRNSKGELKLIFQF